MANNNQALDLEVIHREMNGITEQIRIMNEINARLVQHLATNHLPLATLADQVIRIHRFTVVPSRDTQPGAVSTDQ